MRLWCDFEIILQVMKAENSTPHNWKDYYKPKNGVSLKESLRKSLLVSDHSSILKQECMMTSFFHHVFLLEDVSSLLIIVNGC